MVVSKAPARPDTSMYGDNISNIENSFHPSKYGSGRRFVQWYVWMMVITYGYGTDTLEIIHRPGGATPLRRSRTAAASEPTGAEQTDPSVRGRDRRASVRPRAPRGASD